MSRPPDYVEKMRDDPIRAREFTRMLYELHQGLANELAAALDLSGARRLLDLGGGSGVVALALLRRHPELTATVVDLETVCVAGREIAAEHGHSDRITYRAVDFLHDELPGGFDLVVQCDVGVFGDEHARKLWSALNQGGHLVMVEHFAPAAGVLPPARLEWTFLDSLHDPDVSIPTIARVQAQLAQTGFQVLPDEKTLPDGRVLLQARK
jgi:predicted TPR repeat methyltransferase